MIALPSDAVAGSGYARMAGDSQTTRTAALAAILLAAVLMAPSVVMAQTVGTLSVITNSPATQSTGTVTGSIAVSNFPATQAVSAMALPLPAGAATSANQVAPTAAGTTATSASPVQGVVGGVPVAAADATVVAAINAAALPVPLPMTGNTTVDGSTTVAAGGIVQSLFGGATPANGFEICNPGTTDDLWVSDSTTAASNGVGSIRVPANGGCYVTPLGRKPIQAVTVFAATTGDKITARGW